MTFFGVQLLTAIPTAVLAVFAIITAGYARAAFRKQSEEVEAIQQQVKDDKEAQAEQLEVLREQLEDQRKASATQAVVLGLQAEDLHESIRERERLRQATERAQADEISFRMTPTTFPDIAEEDGGNFAVAPGDPVHMAIVSNGSRRPIKNVECRIGGAPDIDLLVTKTHSDLAVIVGRLAATDTWGRGGPSLLDEIARSRALRILPGEEYGFIFEIHSHRAPGLVSQATASFTDDAGLPWQLDQYQHLERLPDSE